MRGRSSRISPSNLKKLRNIAGASWMTIRTSKKIAKSKTNNSTGKSKSLPGTARVQKMNQEKLCRPQKGGTWEPAGKHKRPWSIAYWMMDERPEGVKRKRLTCPDCGRRLLSSVSICHDGCCLHHDIPQHKPKGWWKRSKSKKVRRIASRRDYERTQRQAFSGRNRR